MADKKMTLIASLLAKAESTNSQAERDALNAKAAELCAKYGIDAAMARAAAGKGGKPVTDKLVLFEAAFDDDCQNELAELAYKLAEALGGKAIHLNEGLDKVVKFVAYSSDVARWQVMFTSLTLQMFDGVVREVPGGQQAESARWMRGFTTVVIERVKAAEGRALKAADDSGQGASLVLRDKAVDVMGKFREEFPVTGRAGISRAGVSAAGRAAGRRANIGGVGVGGGTRAAIG